VPSEAVEQLQRHNWLGMKHVGAARPNVRVFVRKGHLERHYKPKPDNEVFSFVPGLKGPNWVWYAQWVPDSEYIEVPNVKEAKGDQDYSQNGVEQVTLTMDNIGVIERTGSLSALFHVLERGYYSPSRGSRPEQGGERAGAANSWFDTWKDKSTQIVIVAGYGEAVFPLFTGLIDNVTLTSRPDQINVTARNMGQFLTDQKCFGDAKNLWVKDPITFCDRQHADNLENAVAGVAAKSEAPGHPARFATDEDENTAWLSQGYGSPGSQDYIDISLPEGRYEDFDLGALAGQECLVSIFATNPRDGAARGTDGHNYGPGWISTGLGHVSGTTIPYVQRFGGVKERPNRYGINAGGGGFIIGDNSKMRLWFTNLARVPADNPHGFTYRAGVKEVAVYNRTRLEAAKTEHWILVDDVSDIVKTVLQWVGLTEWEIESVGVRLKDKLVFDRQTFLIDIIKRIADLTSYVFYVKAPENFDLDDLSPGNVTNKSMGIAVFRQNSAMKQRPLDRVEAVKDTNLLTAVEAKFDANVLAQSIRVRGKAVGAKQAQSNPAIHPLGADPAFRYQYSYRPVWARSDSAGQGHLRRYELHYDHLIKSEYECKVACLFIAFRMALESAKAEIELPLWPLIQLDHQVLMFDTGTGLSTRLWVATRSWNWSSGEQGEFKMNLGGSLLDINDVQETRQELERLLNDHGYMPASIARGPWEDVKAF
jgi:hypothetical protein